MQVKVYQIDMERDANRVCFLGLANLEQFQGRPGVDAGIYDLVYDGDVNAYDLEHLYTILNRDHPADYRVRSLSVSDVVETGGKFYYVDNWGFTEVPEFNPALAQDGRRRDG